MSDEGWQQRKRPPRLERRVEFADYEATRDFLDAVAEVCEEMDYYPDISFGRTYVNLTIHADDDETVSEEGRQVAERIDRLVPMPD
jgi:pterin-4a-carbinolamine dehydratase